MVKGNPFQAIAVFLRYPPQKERQNHDILSEGFLALSDCSLSAAVSRLSMISSKGNLDTGTRLSYVLLSKP
jgi:hypothetical protein